MLVNKQHRLYLAIQSLEKKSGFFCIKNPESKKTFCMAAQCIRNSAMDQYIRLDRKMHRSKDLQADFDNNIPLQVLVGSYTADVYEAEELMDKMNIPNQRYA